MLLLFLYLLQLYLCFRLAFQSLSAKLLQVCATLCIPMYCSLPGSSVCGIFQTRILEQVAIPFSIVSFWPRDQIRVSCIAGRFFTIWPLGRKDWGQKEKEVREDEIIGWHHQLNGHEFEKTPGDSEGQGSLACCSSWGCKESEMT